jgi:hypothetical protein
VRRFVARVAVLVVLGLGCGIAIGASLTSSAPKSKPAPLTVLQQERLIANCIDGGHPADCRQMGMPINSGPPPLLAPGANAVLLVQPA